ncbi:hypothetical protein K474DRAFT_1495202 [Panus rudis PR-1116 ss-1]|nr:hypothetical protein K474DRAFT_1495202 [Panus rudis PR-1116 ss-1]
MFWRRKDRINPILQITDGSHPPPRPTTVSSYLAALTISDMRTPASSRRVSVHAHLTVSTQTSSYDKEKPLPPKPLPPRPLPPRPLPVTSALTGTVSYTSLPLFSSETTPSSLAYRTISPQDVDLERGRVPPSSFRPLPIAPSSRRSGDRTTPRLPSLELPPSRLSIDCNGFH